MSKTQYEQDYEAGKVAALNGVYATECPWSYKAMGSPAQEVFDRMYRPRLDAWMRGWIDNAPPKPKRPAQGGWKRSKLHGT